MKQEATRLTKARRCEIIAKLSKTNALGQEYEVNEADIQKVWDNQENMLQQTAFMF